MDQEFISSLILSMSKKLETVCIARETYQVVIEGICSS